MKTGIELITEERTRQHEKLWGDAHDDEHTEGELAKAAAVYALDEETRNDHLSMIPGKEPDLWPFYPEWYKPTPENRVRELQKAGALIAAEIDRLQRRK